MNDADRILGPKPAVAMPPVRKNVNNWHPRTIQLWGILDAFKEEFPHLIMTARDRTTNYAAAKEILQIIGEKDGPKFVHRAAGHRRKHNLAVGSLYSLIQYRFIWFGDKPNEDTSKYLRGVDDETE